MSNFPSADLVCPITLELPFDPVTAEDGRVYERSAIEQHIATQGDNLKSPMTNDPMGRRLLPAVQHKNMIETLIERGVLTGNLVSKWNEKVNEKNAMKNLLKEANNGDAEAMLHVGFNYFYGERGFKQDHQTAFSFFRKAHEAGSASGTAAVGNAFYRGYGVAQSSARGNLYMGIAAGKGSMIASYTLGITLAHGLYGMEVDKKEAIRWLRVAIEGGPSAVDGIGSKMQEDAQKLLCELTAVSN